MLRKDHDFLRAKTKSTENISKPEQKQKYLLQVATSFCHPNHLNDFDVTTLYNFSVQKLVLWTSGCQAFLARAYTSDSNRFQWSYGEDHGMFRRHEFELTSESTKWMTYRSIRDGICNTERRSFCRAFWARIQPNVGDSNSCCLPTRANLFEAGAAYYGFRSHQNLAEIATRPMFDQIYGVQTRFFAR